MAYIGEAYYSFDLEVRIGEIMVKINLRICRHRDPVRHEFAVTTACGDDKKRHEFELTII